MKEPPVACEQEIACQQVLLEDASVFSIQWSLFPARCLAELSPETLLERYLVHIRRWSAGIIRPHGGPAGIEFRLAGTGLSLISFMPQLFDGKSLLLRIRGGLLVQPRRCAGGELRFDVEEEPLGVRVSLRLSGYSPRLLGGSHPSPVRIWLYSFSQGAIHRLVTVRFLASLFRELCGKAPGVRMVRVHVLEGRPV
jgi:hypothetical protein